MGAFVRQSVAPAWRASFLDAFLAALSARPAGALLTAPMVHLLKQPVTIRDDTVVGDFTLQECNFSGYAAAVLPTLVGPINPLYQSRGLTAGLDFILATASPLVTNAVYGYWIDHNAGADWVLAELFADPVQLAHVGDYVALGIVLPLASVEAAQ